MILAPEIDAKRGPLSIISSGKAVLVQEGDLVQLDSQEDGFVIL